MSKLYRVHHGAFGHVSMLELTSELVTHAHSTANISFWLGGASANLSINGRAVGHDAQSAVLINSLVPHALKVADVGEPAQTLSFYLDPDWLTRTLPADLPRDFVQLELTIASTLRAELWTLTDLLLDRGVDTLELDYALIRFLQHAVAACRCERAEAAGRSRKPSDFRLRKAVSLMRDNIARGLDLEAVARASGLSRPHFFSIFRDQLELTPGIFWNSLRMEKAVHKMGQPGETLTSVASSLGFNAQGNFTRFFRQHTGVAPSAYRCALSKQSAPPR